MPSNSVTRLTRDLRAQLLAVVRQRDNVSRRVGRLTVNAFCRSRREDYWRVQVCEPQTPPPGTQPVMLRVVGEVNVILPL